MIIVAPKTLTDLQDVRPLLPAADGKVLQYRADLGRFEPLAVAPTSQTTDDVRQLVSRDELVAMFDAESGGTADETFCVYTTCELNGYLYLGLSNQVTASAGAIIARLAPDGELTFETRLDEEGVASMVARDGRLHIVGADAAFGDDWSFGNVYVRDTDGAWTKRRTVPNAMHILGQAFDGAAWWVCTAGYEAGQDRPQVFMSGDLGVSWTKITDPPASLPSRAYWLIIDDDRLFVACGIQFTTQVFYTERPFTSPVWQALPADLHFPTNSRPVKFERTWWAAGTFRGMIRLDTAVPEAEFIDTFVSRATFPFYVPSSTGWNPLVTVGDKMVVSSAAVTEEAAVYWGRPGGPWSAFFHREGAAALTVGAWGDGVVYAWRGGGLSALPLSVRAALRAHMSEQGRGPHGVGETVDAAVTEAIAAHAANASAHHEAFVEKDARGLIDQASAALRTSMGESELRQIGDALWRVLFADREGGEPVLVDGAIQFTLPATAVTDSNGQAVYTQDFRLIEVDE